MADLGNLYFDVLLRNKTASEAAKIKKDILSSLSATLDVTFDPTKLKADVRKAVSSVTGGSLDVGVKVSSIDDAKLQALKSKVYTVKIEALCDDIADKLQKVIDKKSYSLKLRDKDIAAAVQSALTATGFTATISPKIKTATIQADLDSSNGGRPYKIKMSADVSQLVKDIKTYMQGRKSIKASIVAYKNDLLKSIHDIISNSKPFKISVVVDKASARKAVQDALSKISAWNGKYTADDLRAARGQAAQQVAAARAAEAHARAQLALARAYNTSASGAGAHARASISLGNAMGANISLAGQLKDQFLNLYSVYALQNFLRNVIQIGGELEKQQLAMGAILQNTSQATEISSKLKTLAVRSPFGVLDLNKFAKQLTAYSIPYNELYDTMKRLADISAGVGVDMGRIVLAYGQIRAAKFLKGTELRQLTEANIPMVDKLAERFSKLEGRIISASEVMDMISKKKVSFEDVKAVLWEMTGEGGMFYNMQENLAESVSAKWKNLGDAIDIVYGDVASSTSGILKSTAELLTSIVTHWEMLGGVLGSLAASYALFRLYSFAQCKILSNEVIAQEKLIIATKRREADNLRLSRSYRTLTAAEMSKLAASNRLRAADLKQQVLNGQITKDTILRLVATKKLTVADAGHLRAMMNKLLVMNTTSDSMKKLIRETMLFTNAELRAANGTAAWTMRFKALGLQIKNFFVDLGKGLVALASNPLTWIMAAISAGIEMWMYFSQKSEEAQRMTEEIQEKGDEGFKRLSETAKKYPVSLALDTTEFIQAIEEMDQTLKDYHPDYGSVYNMVFGGDDVKSAAEQYALLATEVQNLAEAYKLLALYKNAANIVGDDTDGWFDESLKDNIEDYEGHVRKVGKASLGIRKHYSEVTKAIEKAAAADAGFAQAIASKTSIADKVELLREYQSAYKKFFEVLGENKDRSAHNAAIDFLDEIYSRNDSWRDEIMPDVQIFADSMMAYFTGEGWDFGQLSSEQQNLVRMLVNFYVGTAKNVSEETKKKVSNEILLKMNITPAVDVVDDSLKDRIDGWKKELNELTDGEFEVEIKAASNVNDAVDAIKKAYKAAKEEAETLKPILLKAGLSFKDVNLINAMSKNADGTYNVQVNGKWINGLSETAVQAMNDLYKLQEVISAAEKGSNALGFSLEDNKKKGSGKGQSDKELEKIKHQYDTLKKAYQMYKELKDTYGSERALEMMKADEAYAGLFSDKDFDIEDYEGNVKKLAGTFKLTTEARKDFHQTLMEDIFKASVDRDKKAAQEALKNMEDYISKMSEKWSLYKQLFETTGDSEFASRAFSDFAMWDRRSDELKELFSKRISELGADVDVASINWFMDSSEAERFFGENKDLLKLYQEIQKVITENGREYLKNSANAAKSTQSINDQIQALECQKTELIDMYKKNFGDAELSPEMANQLSVIDQQINKLKSDFFELSSVYEMIFGDNTYRSFGAVQQAEDITRQLLDNIKEGPLKNGKPEYYTSFYMDNGEMQSVILTRQQLEKLKKQIDQFYKVKNEKNSFRNLIDAYSDLKTTLSNKDAKPEDKAEAWGKFAQSFSESAKTIGGACGQLSSMFEALGNESMAQAMDDAGAAMNSVANIGSAFAKGGLIGGIAAAASEAVGWIGRIANAHDRKLDKAIDKSKLKYKELQNVYDAVERALKYALGSGADVKFAQAEDDIRELDKIRGKMAEIRGQQMDWFDILQLQKLTKEQNKLEKRKKAYQEGGAYGYQRALMQEQLKELETQRQAELDKKKTDKNAVADYDSQIAEMTQNIKDFAEEAADSLYGINLKDWASQLGDALYDAWKKGEDGAEAFKKKTAEIMGDVMNSVLKLAILEPAMAELQEMLFGKDRESGMFGADFSLDEGELESIADYLMGISSKTDDYYDMLDKLNNYMESKYGVSMKEEADSGGLSKGIQSVTENTADLLASYINAIRADVSLKREYARKLVEELFPTFNAVALAQLQQLEMIQLNTARNVELVSEIRDMINSNVNPGKGFKIA